MKEHKNHNIKFPFLARLLFLFPLLIIWSVVWACIGIFSQESLGRVLKETGENLLDEKSSRIEER